MISVLSRFGLTGALVLASCAAQGPAALPRSSAIDEFLTKELKALGAPGMSVAIVQKGQLVYARGFGYADLQTKTSAKPDTVFRIGSMTKQFTATIIMQLVGERKLSLNTKLSEVLPDSPKAWGEVTVEQLLSHTAGIPNYTSSLAFLKMVQENVTVDHINDSVRNLPLEFSPGSQWKYSNSGYILLGQIIEKLTGKPYAEELQRRILDPLGMHETYFVRENVPVKNRASGYTFRNGAYSPAAFINMTWPYAAGSIESTVLDLAKWDAALYTNKVLPQSALEQMWTPVRLTTGEEKNYGFGWIPSDLHGVRMVSHGGGIFGFASDIMRLPSIGLTVIVLTNWDIKSPEPLALHLLAFLDSRLGAPATPAVEDKDAATTAFIKKTLSGFLEGKADPATVSPELRAALTPEVVESTKQLGPIQSMELTRSRDQGGLKMRTYRITFANGTAIGDFTIDQKGVMIGALLHPG